MGDQFKARTMKRKNVKGLALSAPPPPPAPSEPENGQGGNDNSRADTLEIGVEFRFDLRSEDLEMIKELGAGNGGTVSKVRHTGWNVVMARKIIHVEAKKEVRKRIVRELQIMHECNSPYIVSFYGAFMNESGDVTMCMEYADCGSLDSVSKNFGPVRVDVLGKIAEAVLGGLKYLYLAHRIMHRDIKPSNILVNSRGQIKLCDFGVSSELVNSVADTFVGTGTYMAPERIQGSPYTVKSDVWSVGLTLMELAIGKFPFSVDNEDDEDGDGDSAGPQGILDLLQQIVLEPAPVLPKSDAFPQILEDVIAKCMMKKPDERPTPQELYDTDPFLQAAKRTPVDLEQWAVGMMERHNRKSHLAPPLSPATAALLRGEDTSQSRAAQSARLADRTPTTSEMPISASTSASTPGYASTTASTPGYASATATTPGHATTPASTPGYAYPPSISNGSMSTSAASTISSSGSTPRPFPQRTSSAQTSVPSYQTSSYAQQPQQSSYSQQSQQPSYAQPQQMPSYSQGQMNLPIRPVQQTSSQMPAQAPSPYFTPSQGYGSAAQPPPQRAVSPYGLPANPSPNLTRDPALAGARSPRPGTAGSGRGEDPYRRVGAPPRTGYVS